MAFTTDLTTDIGKVRLYLSDLDSTNPIFPDDDMIQAFLNEELGDLKLAAAFGYEVIAGNQALLLKVMQLGDLKQDGLSTSKALLAVAMQIRSHNTDDWSGMELANVTDNSDFSFREFLVKQIIAQR